MANTTTVGQRLRQARLDRNISLDELQQITKIQKRYLEAIEEDFYEEMPGSFYVRAFVRQYAAAVGEDGDKLVAVLDGKETLEGASVVSKRKAPETVQGSRKSLHKEEKPENPVVKLLPVIFFGLVAATIVIFVLYVTLQERKEPALITGSSFEVTSESSSAATSETQASTTTESKPEPKPEPSSEPPKPEEKKMAIALVDNQATTATVNVTDATNPIKLDFIGKPTGPCWVGVMVNGAWVYQYTLQAGETQATTLPEGTAEASIVLGAAANLDIHVNGENMDFHGGNVLATRKTITANFAYKP